MFWGFCLSIVLPLSLIFNKWFENFACLLAYDTPDVSLQILNRSGIVNINNNNIKYEISHDLGDKSDVFEENFVLRLGSFLEIRELITNYLMPEIEASKLGDIWVQQDDTISHTLHWCY